MGQRKEKLEFRTSEVGAICVREEGAQEMCVRGPLCTGAGRNSKSLIEQPLGGGAVAEWGFWSFRTTERPWGFNKLE